MTGDKLSEELMKIRSDIPIILCTGNSNRISAEKASQIGIRAFTYKPILRSDLAKTIRKVLDGADKSRPEHRCEPTPLGSMVNYNPTPV